MSYPRSIMAHFARLTNQVVATICDLPAAAKTSVQCVCDANFDQLRITIRTSFTVRAFVWETQRLRQPLSAAR